MQAGNQSLSAAQASTDKLAKSIIPVSIPLLGKPQLLLNLQMHQLCIHANCWASTNGLKWRRTRPQPDLHSKHA